MARTVLSIAGAVIGFYIGGPYGAMIGSTIGGTIGAYIDKPDDIHGPRLEDRRVQISNYGAAIPYLFGAVRVAGNVIWAAELEEVATEEEVGGKGGPGQGVVSYSYYGTFAVLLGFGRCRGIRRVWGDAVLLYDATVEAGNQTPFVFYGGSEEQLPDPTIEAALGIGSTPAFRGYAYLVFERLALERFGNRLPSVTVELVADGAFSSTQVDLTTTPAATPYVSAVQRADGRVVTLREPTSTSLVLAVVDSATGANTLEVTHPWGIDGDDQVMCYVPPLNELWIGLADGIYRFDADTLAYVGRNTGVTGSARLVYDPVRRMVFYGTGNTQHLQAGGTNVVLSTDHQSTYVIFTNNTGAQQTAGEDGSIDYNLGPGANMVGLDGTVYTQWTGAVVGTQTGDTGFGPSCYDPLRSRYVVLGDSNNVYTVSDTNPPTITSYSPAGFSPSIVNEGGLLYDGSTDTIVVLSVITGITSIHVLDAGTFAVLYSASNVSTNGVHWVFGYGAGELVIVGSYEVWRLPFFGTTVGATVAALCKASGLTASDYNVAALTQTLRGYIVGQQSAARGAIEQLALAYQFEGAEVDDVLVFTRRGGASVATITTSECGAERDVPGAFPIQKTRGQELDLPARLTVTAPDPFTDHQPGTQYAERLAHRSGEQEAVQLAVVLTATESKRLADALLFDRWASRERGSVSLTRKFARLAPTDVVTLDGDRVRILSRSDEGGVLRLEFVADDVDVVAQTASGVQGAFPGQSITQTVPTTWVLLDTALLRDADNSPGAYVAAWGVAPQWRGGVLMVSDDGGASWVRELTVPSPGASIGVATNALGNFTGGAVFDEANTLNVTMQNGTPASATRAAVLTGSNYAAVRSGSGWEVIQYRDVTLESNGTYTLRGLLRGRRGTEWANAGHAIGDYVVLLSSTTIRPLDIESSLIGVARDYRAVSVGDTIAASAQRDETIAAARLEPWAPVDLRAARASDGAITLTWKRRTRLACRFTGTGGINVPLGESSESYVVEVFNGAGYASVVRTISGLTSASAAYTAAQQVTDFGSTQSRVYVRVYQLSATVSRGYSLQAAA